MNTNAHSTSSSAVASTRAPATRSLELCEARILRDGIATLLRAERAAAAEFLLALADFDRQRGWEPLGHASLFAFLHVELGLSKGGAFFRQSAARLLQRFPNLIEPLRDGRLCITTVVELAKVLTEANRAEVLPRFYGCSSQEAREVVAALAPVASPPVRAVVTAVVAPRATVAARTVEVEVKPTAAPAIAVTELVQSTEPVVAHPARVAAPRDDVEPLTADLRRLHVTVSRQFLKKLNAGRDGLAHTIPGATTEQVLEAALDLLLDKQARARGQVKRPRTSVPAIAGEAANQGAGQQTASPPPRASPFAEPNPPRRTGPREEVPAAVRRAVWERDGGRCTWPLDGGGCCGSTHRIELDHVLPWARDGQPTVDGLRLLCRPHNALAARQAFGERWMARYLDGHAAPRQANAVVAQGRGGAE